MRMGNRLAGVWGSLVMILAMSAVSCADIDPIDLTDKKIHEIILTPSEPVMRRGASPGSSVDLDVEVVIEKEDGSLKTVKGDYLSMKQLSIRVTDGRYSSGQLVLSLSNPTAWREGYTVTATVKDNPFEGSSTHFGVNWNGFKTANFPDSPNTDDGPSLTLYTARVYAQGEYWRLTKAEDAKQGKTYWIFSREGVPLKYLSDGDTGSSGSNGGECQDGGPGGNGGDGGDLLNYFYSYDAQSFLTLDSQGGSGGAGGSGGSSRSATETDSGCSAGSSGSSGSSGRDGVTRNIPAAFEDVVSQMEGIDLGKDGSFVD